MIVSGNGGSGTTTFTTNIASALAKAGAKVLVFDMNIGLRNDDIYLGMENNILFDLGDVVAGVCSLEKAILECDDCENLFLLPCPQCKGIAGFSGQHVSLLLGRLKEEYDYVFVDCPVGIGKMFEHIALACDKALLIATPDYLSVRNTDAVSRRLKALGLTNRCFAVNKIMESDLSDSMSLEWISKTMCIPLVGMVLFDENIHVSNNRGLPIALGDNAFYAKTFTDIAVRTVT